MSDPSNFGKIKEKIDKMVSQKIIEPISSIPDGGIINPANILIQNDKIRMLLHSKLNVHYNKPKMELRTINYYIDQLASVNNIIKHDFEQAFYQLPIRPENRKLFIFEFENIYYQYRVLPFGYAASSYFCNGIIKLITDYICQKHSKFCYNYLDDVIEEQVQ